MRIEGFTAAADIIGRRVRIGWDFVPDASETIADVPPVTLRRKLRDYAFPDAKPGDRDVLDPLGRRPYLVYDDATFPPLQVPDALAVTDLPAWESADDDWRTVHDPVSVAVLVEGRMVEIVRRTIGTTYDAAGTAVRQHVEILDTGRRPGDLSANTVYYYELSLTRDLAVAADEAVPLRSAVMVTDCYALNRRLYDSLPAIYRRHDVETPKPRAGSETVPEMAGRSGQLRRFVDVFGIALDSLRGTAEGLRNLHDIDGVDARYLTSIAQWIGWDLSVDNIPVELRRNELKAASRLYRLVGTLPGLRALVSQLTGWSTQVAELSQNVALSNQPPQRNLFAVTASADPPAWVGVDDAADVVGFGAANRSARGSKDSPAILTGAVSEPFALRAGMELTLKIDGLLPVTVRFGPEDFADIGRASAAELAKTLARAVPDAVSTSQAGKIVVASESTGEQSQLEIIPAPSSLVSLEGAPNGRLSTFADSLGRLRLFYEAWETVTQSDAGAPSTSNLPSSGGSHVVRRVRFKTFIDGTWRGSHLIFKQRLTQQADPTAFALPDDRIWAAWIDDPLTARARLRFAIGAAQAEQPARILGQRRGPFLLKDGSVLSVTGNWPGVDRFTVHASSFPDVPRGGPHPPAETGEVVVSATAADVVRAMNTQLTHVVASLERDGSIGLTTKTGGTQATARIDLRQSTAARALGFDNRSAIGTPGSWNDEIEWSSAMEVVSIPPGRIADLAGSRDPIAGVRLAWAAHRACQWAVRTAFWQDQILVATANGLFARAAGGAWAAVGGLPSLDVREVALDADGTAWIATAKGAVGRRPDAGFVAVALPSPDVRHVLAGAGGTTWFATAAGASARGADGTITTFTVASHGLPSDDVVAIAETEDGAVWIATAAGLAQWTPGASKVVGIAGDGLPSGPIRDIVADRQTLYIATAAGLVIGMPGAFIVVTDSSGLRSSDVRSVTIAPDETVWVATARGASARNADGKWTTVGVVDGLASDDVRTVSVAANGATWIGTSAGLTVISAVGAVAAVHLAAGGTADSPVRAIQTGWSASRELAASGGGNREPTLAVDDTNRTWLVWSQRVGTGNIDESWSLHCRVFDPVARTWGAEQALTSPPPGVSDRMPSALKIAGGMRMFFSSNRGGGSGLWSVDVSPAGVAAPPVSLLDEPSSDLAPAPVVVNGAVWLLYRSDRNVPLAQIGSSALEEGRMLSVRLPDNGTLRRFAGHVSVTPRDLVRSRTRREFGDLLSYTPNRPDGKGVLADDELYTRGTLGLYVSPTRSGSPVTATESARLRELLGRFIPANLRALVILRTSVLTEHVYRSDAEFEEHYEDRFPFADVVGEITDRSAAAMAGLEVLQSNTVTNVSANAADLTTLRRRTFSPPLK